MSCLFRQSSLKSQRSLTAAALVEEAEEAKEVGSGSKESMGDGMEDGRRTPEVVMTAAMPDPVKESPKMKSKDATVVPKMR